MTSTLEVVFASVVHISKAFLLFIHCQYFSSVLTAKRFFFALSDTSDQYGIVSLIFCSFCLVNHVLSYVKNYKSLKSKSSSFNDLGRFVELKLYQEEQSRSTYRVYYQSFLLTFWPFLSFFYFLSAFLSDFFEVFLESFWILRFPNRKNLRRLEILKYVPLTSTRQNDETALQFCDH